MEDKIGTLEAGKFADLVILEEDIFKVDPLKIDSVKLLATVFNGEVVFQAE